MKKAIMKKWVKLLRSGEIEKRFNRLEGPDGKCCCLGVLCNIALIEGICDFEKAGYAIFFDGRTGELPNSVRKWAKMKSCNGSLEGKSLIELNDSGKSFTEIADVIEKHWEEL